MKIYKLSFFSNSDRGHCLSWHTSKRDAMKQWTLEKRLAKENNEDVYCHTIEALNLTPTHSGIVKFLNHYTPVNDNG